MDAVTTQPARDRYRWVALSNTTLGVAMAQINSSIVLISLPAIFRGIRVNPLAPQNVGYLLWMLMGYMVVSAVLVVSLGRLGDIFGRVRMYDMGFAVFTVASIGLSLVFGEGSSAALTLICLRIVQGIGGALLMANSAAILTDAFGEDQRGMALGINSVALISGSFVGLILGGLLSVIDWHLIFLVSVPFGLFGTVWAYHSLREVGVARRATIDWPGNLTFGVGLIAILVSITYGIQPYGGHAMGWTNPSVLAGLVCGVILLALFVVVEARVRDPMFRLDLFQVPAFAAGNVASLLTSVARGGLMLVLIIWLQGIWLPLHGVTFERTPLWAAIAMLPLTIGFLIAGPLAGHLSDRHGARPFTTAGTLGGAATFGLMLLLPADFAYLPFAALLLASGLAQGMFTAPNTAGIMNSVPPHERGVASGMRATFQNAGMNLSIGLFFSLIVGGLSSTLPSALDRALTLQGVPAALAVRVAGLPPVSVLFAAFLGYNPVRSLLGPALTQLPPGRVAYLTGTTFFPSVIAGPFLDGLHLTFVFSLVMMLVAATASWLRGGRYVYQLPSPAHAPARPGPPLVAISNAYGARGREIGRAVAEALGVRYIDRAIPSELAVRVGDPEAENSGFALLLEELAQGTPLFGPARGADGFSDGVTVSARTAAAIAELARGRGAVVMGHGAAAILRECPEALRVRVDGPPEARLHQAMEAQSIDEATARHRLEATDHARQAFVRRLFDRDVRDPTLYHLMLDSTALSPRACTDLIVAAARSLSRS